MPNSSLVARSGFVPLLVHENHASDVVNAYFAATTPEAFDRMRGERADDAPWNSYKVDNGVALIPVMGALIPRGTFAGSLFGVTSYEGLQSELRRAARDASVRTIALMIDSPGGYVSGLDAVAYAVKAAAAEKTVTAYVQGMACSAAYWIASQCDEIVCSPQAELGSIGVVQAHFDLSGMLDQIGVKVTLLHAGAKKVDGNPYEPLPERVKAEMTQRLEDLRMAFAEAVAEGRADLDVAAVLATEAATFVGADAVKRGLADRVGFLAEDIPDSDDLFVTSPAGRFMETVMNYTKAQLDAAVDEAKAAGYSAGQKAGHDEGRAAGFVAGRTEGHAAGKAEGLQEGAGAERARIKSIMGGDDAKGREDLAAHFAYDTDMPAASAVAALGKSAKAAPASDDSLSAEMRGDRQARVAPDGGTRFEDLTGEARGAAIAHALGYGAKKSA